MLGEFDINLNKLLYSDLPEDTFANRITKAKLMADISQEKLYKAVGLSRATINELEAGYRDTPTKDTLLKLLTVLDMNILCDDYCKFILDQENIINQLISTYGIKELSNRINVHRSTIERWRDGKNQIKRNYYNLLKECFPIGKVTKVTKKN